MKPKKRIRGIKPTGKLRLPISKPGGTMGGKKPKYDRKEKHRKDYVRRK
jgi:hypothetical protein